MNRVSTAVTKCSRPILLAMMAATCANGAVTDLGSTPVLKKSATLYSIVLTNHAVWVFGQHNAGNQFALKIAQNATGGWTNVWPAGVRWSGGQPPSTTTRPGHWDVIDVLDDGARWIASVRDLDYSDPCVVNCNHALRFGNNPANFVSVPRDPVLYQAPFTAECWFKADATNTADVGIKFIEGAGFGWLVWMRGSDDFGSQINVRTSCGFPYANDWFHPIEDGAWHHLAGTFDGTTAILYVDGVKIAPTDACVGTIGDPGVDLMIQGGVIDELRFSSVIRYSGNFTPATSFPLDANTVSYWKFDEGGGTVANDVTGHHNGVIHGTPEIVEGR